MIRWTASILGENATGKGSRDTFDFTGTINAECHLEGTANMWVGSINVEGQHADGGIAGEIIHKASCTWAFELTRDA